MDYVYNITFVMLPNEGERFLTWMRSEAVPRLFGESSKALEPRVQTVIEAGGEKPAADHGLSIALQAMFSSKEEAYEWHDSSLPAVLGEFTSKFGPNALFFTTLLEVFPL